MDATDYSTVESDAVYYQPPTSGYRQSKSKTAGRSSSSSSASSVSSPSTSRQPSPLSERAPPPLASLSMNLTEPSPNSFPQHSPLVLSSHSRSQIGSSSDSLSIHTLRSNTRYSNQTTYQPKNQHLLNVYKEVYDYFYSKRPIPAELRHRLESIYVTEDEFIKLVVDRECPDGRYISLVDNKIVLDECTNPPHGALIFAIASQIGSQDAAGGHLLIGGTGDRITPFYAELTYLQTLPLHQEQVIKPQTATGRLTDEKSRLRSLTVSQSTSAVDKSHPVSSWKWLAVTKACQP